MFAEIALKDQRQASVQRFERRMADAQEVVACWVVSGRYDYLVRIACPTLDDYHRLINAWLDEAALGIEKIVTNIELQTIKEFTGFPVPRQPSRQRLSCALPFRKPRPAHRGGCRRARPCRTAALRRRPLPTMAVAPRETSHGSERAEPPRCSSAWSSATAPATTTRSRWWSTARCDCLVWDVRGPRVHRHDGRVFRGQPRPPASAHRRRGQRQLEKVAVTSRAYHSTTLGPFLAKLCEVTGFDRALPMNTGAEAVETAIKCARRWGYRVKGIPDGQAEILVARGNFHGRTNTIIGFSSEAEYRAGFGPFTPGLPPLRFRRHGQRARPPPAANTCAVLIEPIQGEAGIVLPPPGFFRALRDWCTQQPTCC